ncbi:hypothetical protein BDV25DRAFT_170321 [Aspergillus avenaceus]|uniref:Rhodopsin domain-containing protein n=1 Tax=Aspergillus avenaceus TaxID=36643 RepID=A0A5N6U8Q3_ASPAV|nr:hypothetical protein BDV25DRAFT_170321 [Aspergillus avenaceus]
MESIFQPRSEEVDNRGPPLLIINGAVTGVAAIVVALRIISRALVVKRFGLDDWTITAATITAILNVAVAGLGVKYGTGKHKWDLSKADAVPAAKLRYVTHIIYTVISGLIKLSICLLYLRLFPNIRRTTLGTIAFITAMSIAIILATIFQCSPIDAVYNITKYENYSCFPSIPFWYATAALSLVTDIWILLLPIKTILGLQVGTKKRFVLIGLLSMGAFACIASIIRMVYIVKLYQSSDPSWDTFGVSVSSGIEVAIAIIASSIPSIKPIVDILFPRLFPTVNASHTAGDRMYGDSSKPVSHFRRQHEDMSLVQLTAKEYHGDEIEMGTQR